MNVFREAYWFSPDPISFQPDQVLIGFFQSFYHFHHHREQLLQIFAPSQKMRAYLNEKYADLLHHPNTVAIHVRTFSPYYHAMGYLFIGLSYYQKAIQEFPNESQFVIFSDRIGWCKRYFSILCPNAIYIEGNSHVEDFFLMSQMKHQIIANSSFSWWAAYLNANPDKQVIAPNHWLHPNRMGPNLEIENGFLLPEWKVLPIQYDDCYPVDMLDYDRESQSLHEK